MYNILLYFQNLPLINVEFILTKVHTPMYIMRTHSMSCSVVLLCCRFKNFLFAFLTYPNVMLHNFSLMSSRLTCHTDIILSSDIFLDSLINDIHVL